MLALALAHRFLALRTCARFFATLAFGEGVHALLAFSKGVRFLGFRFGLIAFSH